MDEVAVVGKVRACGSSPQDSDWANDLEVFGGVFYEVGNAGEGLYC